MDIFHANLKMFASIRWTVALLDASDKVMFYGLLFILFLQGLLPIIGLGISKYIIDAYDSGQSFWSVLIIACLWLGSLVAGEFLNPPLMYFQSHLNDKFTGYIQRRISVKASSFTGIRYFEDPEFLNRLKLLQADSNYRPLNFILTFANCGRDLIALVSLFGILFGVAWWIPLVLALAFIPQAKMLVSMQKEMWQNRKNRMEEIRMTTYLSSVGFDIATAKEMRIFDTQRLILSQYDGNYSKYMSKMKAIRKEQATKPVLSMLLGFGIVLGVCCWVILKYQSTSTLTAGDISIFMGSILQASMRTNSFFAQYAQLSGIVLFFDELMAFLSCKDDLEPRAEPREIGEIKEIRFEGVSFRYAAQGSYALQDVSFCIDGRQKVAIVGKNGAGKSTLLKLMLRFYDVTEGAILINGVDIREIDVKRYREEITAVFQDFAQYSLGFEENITLSDELVDKAKLADALRQSKIEHSLDEVAKMKLGKALGGQELSGGQWQKIALARAIYKSASLVMMDEPTSALDPISEAEFLHSLYNLVEQRMCIVVTHRLALTKSSDKVLVIDDGQIVEMGSHEELLQAGGKYAQMYMAQAQFYQ